MKRTILQRQVQALSEDLREIGEMLEEEEAEVRKVAEENKERSERDGPLAPYRTMRRGQIKRLLEFVEGRLSNTIKALELEENIGQGLT